MNFFKPKHESENNNPFHRVLSNVQTHFTNFTRDLKPMPFFSNDSISDHIDKCRKIYSSSSSSSKNNLSVIKERLKDVPVYRLRDNSRQLVYVGSTALNRRASLFFLNKDDAQDLANDCNTIEINKMDGVLQVKKVPLASIIKLEEEGISRPLSDFWFWFMGDFLPAFAPESVNKFVRKKISDPNVYLRLVPDMSEVKNALQERKKAGLQSDTFSGVPVFQSDALKLRVDGSSNNPLPAFFRKADLEKALRDKKQMNQVDTTNSEIIEVTALEDIIQEMKDCSTSKWNNVILVPPGGKP